MDRISGEHNPELLQEKGGGKKNLPCQTHFVVVSKNRSDYHAQLFKFLNDVCEACRVHERQNKSV